MYPLTSLPSQTGPELGPPSSTSPPASAKTSLSPVSPTLTPPPPATPGTTSVWWSAQLPPPVSGPCRSATAACWVATRAWLPTTRGRRTPSLSTSFRTPPVVEVPVAVVSTFHSWRRCSAQVSVKDRSISSVFLHSADIYLSVSLFVG